MRLSPRRHAFYNQGFRNPLYPLPPQAVTSFMTIPKKFFAVWSLWFEKQGKALNGILSTLGPVNYDVINQMITKTNVFHKLGDYIDLDHIRRL